MKVKKKVIRTIKPKILPSSKTIIAVPPSNEEFLEYLKKQVVIERERNNSNGSKDQPSMVKVIQLLIVGIDPRTFWGKIIYTLAALTALLWALGEIGLLGGG